MANSLTFSSTAGSGTPSPPPRSGADDSIHHRSSSLSETSNALLPRLRATAHPTLNPMRQTLKLLLSVIRLAHDVGPQRVMRHAHELDDLVTDPESEHGLLRSKKTLL
mmetsp:Transcript_24902/g.42336  ORF Transcript_24902/g.42336 Transcript_24902/m.42336 type:complete len:108 (+) Transcript_24902:739-1062(+)